MSMGSSTFSTWWWDRKPRGPGQGARCRPAPGRTGEGRPAAGRGRDMMRRGGATLRGRGPTCGGRLGLAGRRHRERAPGPDAPTVRAGPPDGSRRTCARGGGGRGEPRLHLRSEHVRRPRRRCALRAPVASPPVEQPLQCSGSAQAGPHRGGVGHSRRRCADHLHPVSTDSALRQPCDCGSGVSVPMSIFHPVSFAARRAF